MSIFHVTFIIRETRENTPLSYIYSAGCGLILATSSLTSLRWRIVNHLASVDKWVAIKATPSKDSHGMPVSE